MHDPLEGWSRTVYIDGENKKYIYAATYLLTAE
jgi:hypothetical protein